MVFLTLFIVLKYIIQCKMFIQSISAHNIN